mmetsp:Transcript_22687/g.68004  ORF Transcript_22687/g.68004 Transcript_22687/m.68004 type:complete len:346 (-) Transcript_22687:9-1046(-)
MTLYASPAWNMVTETTADDSGSVSRAAMAWSAVTTCDAATMGSTTWCGMAAWPPTPDTIMSKSSVAASIGPGRPPMDPNGKNGHWWKPKAASVLGGRSRTPSSTMRLPPAPPSSAGCQMRRIVPLIRCSRRFKTAAAPNSMAAWPSWPHACIRPGVSDFHGKSTTSWIGSASMSARSNTHGSAPVPMCATMPVPPSPLTKPFAASSARLVFFAQPVVKLTLSDARTSAIFADVACSSKRSSGVRCSSRRTSTTNGTSLPASSHKSWNVGVASDARPGPRVSTTPGRSSAAQAAIESARSVLIRATIAARRALRCSLMPAGALRAARGSLLSCAPCIEPKNLGGAA